MPPRLLRLPHRPAFPLTSCRRFSYCLPQPPKPRRGLAYTLATFTLLTTGAVAYINYTSSPPPLNPYTFTPYTLTHRIPVSTHPETALLTLTPQQPPPQSAFSPEKLESVEIKQPALQIARSYTPLPPSATPDAAVRLIIKREPQGEMSRYLLSLSPGDTVWLRGPREEYVLPREPARLLFLAGGTGIAPALQCAERLLGDGRSEIFVVWAVRGRGETEGEMAGVMDEMQRKFGGRFKVQVKVDSEGGVAVKEVWGLVQRWRPGRVLVCGPEGFVGYWAGEKGEWIDGRETQGRLGGVLAGLVKKGVEVWKL